MPRVTGLFLYPVKSCRGHSVPAAEIGDWGFVGDRHFLIVDANNRFVTQRQEPRLARIDTDLRPDALNLGADGFGSVSSPLGQAGRNPSREVVIWKNTVQAEDCGDGAAEWLTRFLGAPHRLVRIGADYHRPVKPSRARPGDEVSFADAFPFLLISEASHRDLCDRLLERDEEPVPMDRFRPNIVVGDCDAFAEDEWNRFSIGGVTMRQGGPCIRCIVTTTDQRTGERGKEPLRTLATYRRSVEDPTDVKFGANVVHETKRGRIRVGDSVTLLPAD